MVIYLEDRPKLDPFRTGLPARFGSNFRRHRATSWDDTTRPNGPRTRVELIKGGLPLHKLLRKLCLPSFLYVES